MRAAIYARVSTQIGWIRDTIENGKGGQQFGPIGSLKQGGWPATPAGIVATAFFAAYAGSTDEPLARFEKTYRTSEALKNRPVPERLAAWKEYRARWGTLHPVRFAGAGEEEIAVLARAGETGEWLELRFLLVETAPPRLRYIAIVEGVGPQAAP